MGLGKAGKYAVLLVGLLVVLSVVVSVVTAIVGFVWNVITTAVTLLVVAAVAYGIFKAVRWLGGSGSGDAGTRSVDAGSTDPVDQVTERYVEGDLSEEELERRLELGLDGPDRDEIDRELERSGSN